MSLLHPMCFFAPTGTIDEMITKVTKIAIFAVQFLIFSESFSNSYQLSVDRSQVEKLKIMMHKI